jgi:hypothetical protein
VYGQATQLENVGVKIASSERALELIGQSEIPALKEIFHQHIKAQYGYALAEAHRYHESVQQLAELINGNFSDEAMIDDLRYCLADAYLHLEEYDHSYTQYQAINDTGLFPQDLLVGKDGRIIVRDILNRQFVVLWKDREITELKIIKLHGLWPGFDAGFQFESPRDALLLLESMSDEILGPLVTEAGDGQKVFEIGVDVKDQGSAKARLLP